MAEPRDLTKTLDNIEQELSSVHAPPVPAQAGVSLVGAQALRAQRETVESAERFAPQKPKGDYRNASDSLEQIQQDFRKAVFDMESRFKTVIDELKRVAS